MEGMGHGKFVWMDGRGVCSALDSVYPNLCFVYDVLQSCSLSLHSRQRTELCVVGLVRYRIFMLPRSTYI